MIDAETFERLRQLVNDFNNCMDTRVGSRKEEKVLREECDQFEADIDALEALWRKHG